MPELGLTGEALSKLDKMQLQTLEPVQSKFTEAKTKLQSYRATLTAKYGDELRLRVYAVVALGFERLIWEEV